MLTRSLNILVIDDEPGIRKLIELILEDHEIVTAGSVDEATELLNSRTYDLVISDVKMPGKSGFELLEEIHRINPNTPVILMTGHAEEDELIHPCLDKSAGFLAKPFEDEDLIGMIDGIFSSSDS